jgi:hypothetical protein
LTYRQQRYAAIQPFVRWQTLASVAFVGIGLSLVITLVSCGQAPSDQTEAKKSDAAPKVPQDGLEIRFTYGSEKNRGLKRRRPHSTLKNMR